MRKGTLGRGQKGVFRGGLAYRSQLPSEYPLLAAADCLLCPSIPSAPAPLGHTMLLQGPWGLHVPQQVFGLFISGSSRTGSGGAGPCHQRPPVREDPEMNSPNICLAPSFSLFV